ncbi:MULTISPECIES: IPExxxVDY family protein [Nonlabens]|uniref:IPExxxVDY family protein n=1 Tax=Nonlabens agnitus TaxID=870484 RepID=A0A2S9WVZ8_9FLAO|nr:MULTISPECIES: IPExxxVDY family protein [Nonlabens]KQC32139.1 hypothetical protein AAU57_01485 [Nonlabens sp. YIK11]PRP67536.1 hypothetical protein BST86_10760 [Nonlabens agnitus]
MGTHKLVDWDMEDEPFVLIGIHSTCEPYRMAYFINKYLKVSFKRQEKDQDITLQEYIARFPVYHYKDVDQNASLYLIPNHCRAQIKSTSSAGLFATHQVDEIKTTLIKEYRTVDFLLKIEKDPEHFPLKKLLSELNEIPQVISVYQADATSIKNTDYLIFE